MYEWIEFDRATGSQPDRTIAKLLGSADLTVTEPVIMEVAVGARTTEAEQALRRLLGAATLLRFDPIIDFDGATAIYRGCRQVGITPRGTVDCMILSVAARHDAVVLTADIDMARIGAVAGVHAQG